MLPSLQYSTPSQGTVGGRHIPSAHLSELFARQPTDIATEIMQDTVCRYGQHCMLFKTVITTQKLRGASAAAGR